MGIKDCLDYDSKKVALYRGITVLSKDVSASRFLY